jgi:hypothetical protein
MNLVDKSDADADADAVLGDDTMDGWSIDEANKLFMKQVDKKVITMDNFVTKTSPPQDEMILPKTKELNLKDPKYKKKDIKKSSKSNVNGKTSNEIFDFKLSKIE